MITNVKAQFREMLRQSFHPRDWFVRDDTPFTGDKAMWVYREANGGYVVGYYGPDGDWTEDSRHVDREEAALRVHWLNGGNNP